MNLSVTSPSSPSQDPSGTPSVPLLDVSPSALKKIAAERARRGIPDLLFRITVAGGGCSGLQYQFGYEDPAQTPEEAVADAAFFPAEDPMVVTDSVSLRFLNGATLDFQQDLMGSRFAIKNPNAVSGCGCGVSFVVDFNKF